MFDDLKTKKALETIKEGGTAKLSRSMIVLAYVNLKETFKPLENESRLKAMPKEQKKRVMALVDWYKDVRKDRIKEEYDQAKLDDTVAQMYAEIDELRGPTEEELAEEASKADADVQESEDIDMDDFFGEKKPADDAADDADESEEADDAEAADEDADEK